MTSKKRKIFVIIFLVGSVMLSSVTFYIYQLFNAPNFLIQQDQRILLIYPGTTFKQFQNDLYQGNYVNDLVAFSFLAKVLDVDKNLKPGRYLLEPNSSNLDVIRKLRSGRQEEVRMTFNNVRTPEDLAIKITRNLALTDEAFLKKLKDSTNTELYGFSQEYIIGMFIPNTYLVYWDITADALFMRMKKEYDLFWNEGRLKKADSLQLRPEEVITLASIVKAETNFLEEAPRIAGVYLNRLRRNIALQADPTLVFAMGDFTIKRVLHEHKQVDSPYNTYKYTGLPPGPINLPEIPYIDAVLEAENHAYFYFCAKDDLSGQHLFAEDLNTHINNARRFQRALNRAQIYR